MKTILNKKPGEMMTRPYRKRATWAEMAEERETVRKCIEDLGECTAAHLIDRTKFTKKVVESRLRQLRIAGKIKIERRQTGPNAGKVRWSLGKQVGPVPIGRPATYEKHKAPCQTARIADLVDLNHDLQRFMGIAPPKQETYDDDN